MPRGNLDAPRQHRGRWQIIGLLLIALVWFAPTIIARTSLKDKLITWAVPDLDGRVAIGSARLGWMSPIVLRDVEATDSDGELMLSIAEITGDKSLSALLLDRTDLGTFHIRDPEVHVRVRNTSSNLEDIRNQDPKKESFLTDIRAKIEVEDAHVVLDDSQSNRQWLIEDVNLMVLLLPDSVPGFELSGSGNLSNDRQQSGTISAQTVGNNVRIHVQSVPLDIVEPFLRCRSPDAQLSGTLTGDILFQPGETMSPDADEPTTAVNVALHLDQFELTSVEQLGSDILHLDAVIVEGQLRVADTLIVADQINVKTDFATVASQGTVDMADGQQSGWTRLFADRDCVVKATVDLARLAELLPHTLNIREGTQITSGDMRLHFTSRDAGSGRKWFGRLDSSNLVGQAGGQAVSWQQPISVTFASHDDPTGVVIDQLVCQSDFLQAHGQVTLDAANFTAMCDLNRFVDQLGQFVDVDRWQLAGNVRAQLSWQCREGEPLVVNGSIVAEDFEFYIPPDEQGATNVVQVWPWVERQLTMNLNATGTTGEKGLQRVDTASFRFLAGEDQLTAQLMSPVDYTDESATWPVDLAISGDLGRWTSRLRPWVDLSKWDIRGTLSGVAHVNLADEIAHIESSKIELGSVIASNASWNIDESVVILETTGRLAGHQRELTAGSAVFRCTSVSCKIDDLQIEVPEDAAPAAQGRVKYRADLARLSRWMKPRGEDATQRLSGQLTGELQLAHQGRTTQAEWTTHVENLVVERNPGVASVSSAALPVSQVVAWEPIWSEKRLQFTGSGSLDQDTETFHLQRFCVQSELLAVSATGQISNVLDSRVADVSGQIRYDVGQIVQSLRGYVGPGLELVGEKQHPFTLKGPLADKANRPSSSTSVVPPKLLVTGGCGWNSGNAYGLILGPADLRARLANQIVSFSPIEISVNDGYLRCTPEITFQQVPSLLIVAPGTVLDRISITRQMCNEWLKYVAPLLADATRIDGQLSVDLDHARVPLENSHDSDIQGVATIHSGDVRPGPLAEPFIDIVRRIRIIARRQPLAGIDSSDPRLTMTEQKVKFRLTGGRVHHQDMRVQLGDMPIRTSGSVGLDETLDLVAEIQIPETWIREGSIFSSWKGKVIQIPIRGTLNDPDIDESAIANIATELIPDAVQGIIDRGILRGLDRLLDRD